MLPGRLALRNGTGRIALSSVLCTLAVMNVSSYCINARFHGCRISAPCHYCDAPIAHFGYHVVHFLLPIILISTLLSLFHPHTCVSSLASSSPSLLWWSCEVLLGFGALHGAEALLADVEDLIFISRIQKTMQNGHLRHRPTSRRCLRECRMSWCHGSECRRRPCCCLHQQKLDPPC